MAKKAEKKPRAPRKPAAPGSVRRLTHNSILDGVEGAASYKVFGIAKKVVVQNTVYGPFNGLKGSFEAVAPDGKKLTSKRCFLLGALHSQVAAKMGDGEEVSFGAAVETDGTASGVKASFFAQPQPTDPMANLREQAENA